MRNSYVTLVEDANNQLVEKVLEKLVNEYVSHKDPNKFIEACTTVNDLDEGLVPQVVYDVLNRYILSAPEHFYKLIEKYLKIKGLAQTEIDHLMENIKNTLNKKLGTKNNSHSQVVSQYQKQMGT
jgi:hypothetical protein